MVSPLRRFRPRKVRPLIAGVDQDLLGERFGTYIVDFYTGLHNTAVSVVLAVAGLSAASLAGAHAHYGSSYLLFWIFWLASLLVCVTIFAGTTSGSVALPPMMPATTDLVIPLLLGVGESVLFGTLAHQVTGLNTASAVAEAWFISLAGVCACAAAAVTRAMHLFDAASHSGGISDVIDDYRIHYLPTDRRGAAAVTALGIGGAIASSVHVIWLEYALAGCVVGGLVLALRGHARSTALLRTVMQHAHSSGAAESERHSLTCAVTGHVSIRETGTGWPEQRSIAARAESYHDLLCQKAE